MWFLDFFNCIYFRASVSQWKCTDDENFIPLPDFFVGELAKSLGDQILLDLTAVLHM